MELSSHIDNVQTEGNEVPVMKDLVNTVRKRIEKQKPNVVTADNQSVEKILEPSANLHNNKIL